MNLRWSLVKDRVKDGGGGASTNAHRNPHLVRGLGVWQCGGCAPRDDERGRRPARRGLSFKRRGRTRGSDVISGAWRTGQRLPRPGLGRIPHPPVPRGARSREMDGQGTAEGCPQGGSRLPPASPVPPSPDPGAGGFVIELGGVCYQDTYPDVSCVYPAGYTYPDVS